MTPPLLLLVDDAPEIAVMVRWLAKRAGHGLAACGDVSSAWQHLQTGPRPNLVLLDVNLPGPSGLELCRRLRAAPSLAGLPVALFTQPDRPDDVVAGLDAGADCVVWKDLLTRPPEWQARVGEVLEQGRGRPAAVSVKSLQTAAPLPFPSAAIGAFNQALRQTPLRQLGPPVFRVLARRALACANGALVLPAGGLEECLLTAGPGLDPERITRACPPETLGVLVVALADQVRFVLGSAATAPFRAALADSVPPLSGFLLAR